MSDEPDNIVLAHLRAIRADVQNIGRDVAEVKTRVGRLEIGLAQTNTMFARAQVAIAERSARIDAMDDRLKRIERRLELVGEPTLTPTP